MMRTTTILATMMAATLAMSANLATAQHHQTNKPVNGQVHPGTNPGMQHKGPSPAEIRQYQHEQEMIRKQQEAYEQQLMREQAAALRRYAEWQAEVARQRQMAYKEEVKRFNDYVQSKGGKAGGLPSNYDQLKAWEKAQKALKDKNKPYDPLFDHFAGYQQVNKAAKASAKVSAAAPKASTAAVKASAADAKAAALSSTSTASLPPRGWVAMNWGKWVIPAQDLELMKELRLIRLRLASADQDYDGYRVGAIRDIGRALYYIDPSSAPGLTTGVGVLRYPNIAAAISAPVTPGGTGSEFYDIFGFGYEYENVARSGYIAQFESDAILSESMVRLRKLEPRLQNRSGTVGNYIMAHDHVVSAIQRLEIALTVN